VAPSWLSGGKAVAQAVAGAAPALVLVIFAGVLALLGLACDHGRRAYALAYADRFVDLAAVLVGRPRGPSHGVTGAGPPHPPA
jgi:lactam utilization protein B